MALPQLARGIQHAVVRGKQFAQQRRHGMAQRRQLRALAGFEQRRAQLLLQILHGGRHRRLRTMRALGRQAKTTVVSRQQELAQMLDLQRLGHDGGPIKFRFSEINLR
ncbi:hypothetical protein G6F63_016557 [Rhizopus arrhizus]|nr:hypothetical protein G6F24_017617 [Rhizopus arrhizus]KAG1306313.1 hypothetical protein G6F63_016557 [Rhizopus arrhizus]